LSGRTNFFRASQKRPTPDAFKFFTGIFCSLRWFYFIGLDNILIHHRFFLTRFSMGYSKPAVYRILYSWLGESSSSSSHVLQQRNATSGRILPLSHMQLGWFP
jgi:hypothetical protein